MATVTATATLTLSNLPQAYALQQQLVQAQNALICIGEPDVLITGLQMISFEVGAVNISTNGTVPSAQFVSIIQSFLNDQITNLQNQLAAIGAPTS